MFLISKIKLVKYIGATRDNIMGREVLQKLNTSPMETSYSTSTTKTPFHKYNL